MKQLLLGLLLATCPLWAQSHLIIHKRDGTQERVAVSSIRKVTFFQQSGGHTNGPKLARIRTALARIRPNPCNPIANIDYTMSEPGKVLISVYDIRGVLVRKLVDKEMPTGRQSVVWNGTDFNNKRVSSGSYIIRSAFCGKQSSDKIYLIK